MYGDNTVTKNRMVRKILNGDPAIPNKYIKRKMKMDKPTPKA